MDVTDLNFYYTNTVKRNITCTKILLYTEYQAEIHISTYKYFTQFMPQFQNLSAHNHSAEIESTSERF